MKNKMNKMKENEITMSVIIMSVITGLILSFWIICVSAIMIPVLIDEAKVSSESVGNESVSSENVESMSVENISVDDGPIVFRYVGDWNSSNYNSTYNNSTSCSNVSNVGNSNVSNNVSNVSNSATSPVTTQWFNATAGSLVTELKENALRAENKYQYAHVIVSGKVSYIDSDGKYIAIEDCYEKHWFYDIMCHVTDESLLNEIEKIKIGDSVVVYGKVTDVGEVWGYWIDMYGIVKN